MNVVTGEGAEVEVEGIAGTREVEAGGKKVEKKITSPGKKQENCNIFKRTAFGSFYILYMCNRFLLHNPAALVSVILCHFQNTPTHISISIKYHIDKNLAYRTTLE